MKIGDIYDDNGVKRKVIGFDASGNLVTSTDPNVATRNEDFQEANAEAEKLRGDIVAIINAIPLEKLNKEQLSKIAAVMGRDIPEGTPNAEVIQILTGK